MISVTITRKELETAGACAEWIELFDRIATTGPTGRRRVRIRNWTPLHDVWLAVAYPDFASWLRRARLIPLPSLYGADLKSADLRGADLRGADLRGARLIFADLRDANLDGANLDGAKLIGANLIGANLIGADLAYADIDGADLEDANLYGAYRNALPPSGWRIENGRLRRAENAAVEEKVTK